jgi:hypothetical protein
VCYISGSWGTSLNILRVHSYSEYSSRVRGCFRHGYFIAEYSTSLMKVLGFTSRTVRRDYMRTKSVNCLEIFCVNPQMKTHDVRVTVLTISEFSSIREMVNHGSEPLQTWLLVLL